MKSVTILIPARLGSTRLPEKALSNIHGKPMIQHVYERAKKVKNIKDVVVLTDHQKVIDVVVGFGGQAVLTPESLSSGTDRVAFFAQEQGKLGSQSDIYVNVQGDEPCLEPESVENSVELILNKKFTMTTPSAPLESKNALHNINVVKVLVDQNQRAIYFSRFPIPYSRIATIEHDFACRQHLGVYAYTYETLIQFAALPRTSWEAAESLEQLRALYHGVPIGVASTQKATIGVDTVEELEKVRRLLAPS